MSLATKFKTSIAVLRRKLVAMLISDINNVQHQYISSRQFKAILSENAVIEREGSVENVRGESERVYIGANTHIRGRLFIYGHGGQIKIGDWCYVGIRSEIWSMESIIIGNRVLISHDVNIHDGTAHSTNPIERHNHYRQILQAGHPQTVEKLPGVFSAPIIIEDDVWINFGVTILKGVHIGAGSIVAAGSIVTKDVPPYSLYRSQVFPIITKLEI